MRARGGFASSCGRQRRRPGEVVGRHREDEAVGISPSSVGRTWAGAGLKPHVVRKFKVSNDPLCEAKVTAIVGLYLDPPDRAVVLCVDEKSRIEALDRTQPGLPLKKARAATMTQDCKRHGTTPRRARQVRDRRLQCVEAVVQRPKCVRRNATTAVSSASLRTVERGCDGPVVISSTVARFRRFATVLGLVPGSLLCRASEACDHCTAALTACVAVALP